MAKYLLLIIILIVVFIAGCSNTIEVTNFEECVQAGNPVMESYPRQCSYGDQTFIEELDIGNECINKDGNWLDEFKECLGISKENCESLGGIFNECESACRNNSEAQMCTMQCVIVCDFE